MKETDFKIYNALKLQTEIVYSKIPARVRNSNSFLMLLESEIIAKEKRGKGLIVRVVNSKEFSRFYETHFPKEVEAISKSSNIKKFRDSKASIPKDNSNNFIFFLRGFKEIELNNENIDLKSFTKKFGLFAAKNIKIKTEKICFVENLDTFLKAEHILGKEYVYLHKYGRIGKATVENITANEYLIFNDYDFNGLEEYLRIKSVFKNAMLYIPNNFDELFQKFSKSLKDNKASMTKKVATSQLSEVVKIRELVLKHNRFLEQEILSDD